MTFLNRTETIDVTNSKHKEIVDFILSNDLGNHAIIFSEGKVMAKPLPSHGKVNIVTDGSKVKSVCTHTSELF